MALHAPPYRCATMPTSATANSSSFDSSTSSGDSSTFNPQDLLSDLTQLSFADVSHSHSSSDSEYDPDLNLVTPISRHTLLVEVTRPRPIDNPEAMGKQMEAEIHVMGEVEGWTALITPRLVSSNWEETDGLPVPGQKLLENRARAQKQPIDEDATGGEEVENSSSSSTMEPKSTNSV